MLIDRVFADGRTIKSFPLIARVVEANWAEPVTFKVATVAGKRRFKRAVDRNRVKRLIREAWRTGKGDLVEEFLLEGRQYAVVFIFVGRELPEFKQVKEAMGKMIPRLRAELNEVHPKELP